MLVTLRRRESGNVTIDLSTTMVLAETAKVRRRGDSRNTGNMGVEWRVKLDGDSNFRGYIYRIVVPKPCQQKRSVVFYGFAILCGKLNHKSLGNRLRQSFRYAV